MRREQLVVALGDQLYAVERPWGDLPGGCGKVSDVAVDGRGHVFVLMRGDPYTDDAAPSVVELAPDGRRLAVWGEAIVDGHMLAISPDQRVFVVDRDAHEIVVFDLAGKRVGGVGERHRPLQPFNHPSGIAFAADGGFYVADGYGASRVHRFSPDGRLMGGWGSPGGGAGEFATPHGIWVLADGRVVVADRENDRVQFFSGSGEFQAAFGDFYGVMDVFEDAAGRILVSDRLPRLSALGQDGALVSRCRPVLFGAHGLIGDTAGFLYLAEIDPSRLTRLRPL